MTWQLSASCCHFRTQSWHSVFCVFSSLSQLTVIVSHSLGVLKACSGSRRRASSALKERRRGVILLDYCYNKIALNLEMQRQDLLSFNPSAMESFNSSRGSTVDSVVDEMINHMQPQQQQERKCREWRLVEVQGGRPRSVLQIREWSARLPHRNDEPVLSAPAPLTWHPVWSTPVPSIRVEFKFAEDGVLVTEFESHFEDIRKPRLVPCILTIDLELEIEKWETKWTRCPWQYSKHRIVTEQQHEPSKNLNLLKAAYLSMNAHVPDSDFTFNVPDWVERRSDDAENDIYDQRSPLGNTVLHLAARYGINGAVEKVAQQSPWLFISRNSNDDTALHVAAREGHESTIRMLLKTYFPIATHDENYYDLSDDSNEEYRMDKSVLDMIAMLSLTLFRNSQGNTFLHEALMFNSPEAAATVFRAFEDPFITGNSQFEDDFKRLFHRLALFALNNEEKSLLYLATEARCKEVVNRLMDICDELDLRPQGKSPLLPPIINRDKDMLETILSKKPKWIHLKDEVGTFPLHYAASVGYLEGVSYLIEKCASCTIERDKDGFFPLHLASGGGHVEVVQELLKWCPDPTEMLDEKNGRNFLHIAAENGKYKVINYILRDLKLENILRDPRLERLINQDKNGDTPLHLATRNWHPKIVHALTWDKRVDLALPNQEHQTALDTALQHADENPSLRQRLTWLALHSVDAQRMSLKVPRKEASNPEKYKDRVDTLILVSTLIITASFAAGLALPGSVEKGKAVMLNYRMFHLFIFSITISMYGAISTTIILIWARLGDLRLALLALKFAKPLLGITLGTLSVAFLAGVYLIVSKLRWLAATFLVMGVVMILMVLLLYILLWLPSSSTSPMIRCISYYPFLWLARLAEAETDDGNNMVHGSSGN